MTKKFEELFGFDQVEKSDDESAPQTAEETRAAIVEIDATIDKIDQALPAVRDLDSSDRELDDIAAKATETFENLTDLGFNVDSRYAAELFALFFQLFNPTGVYITHDFNAVIVGSF